jgi:hypothetical protein
VQPSPSPNKTLHDARRKLRKHLDDCGLALDDLKET